MKKIIKNKEDIVKKVDRKRRALLAVLGTCSLLTTCNLASFLTARGTELRVYDDLRKTSAYEAYAEEKIEEQVAQIKGKNKEYQEKFLREHTKNSYIDDKFVDENATQEQKDIIDYARDVQIASGVVTALSGLGVSACVIGLVPEVKLDEEDEREM